MRLLTRSENHFAFGAPVISLEHCRTRHYTQGIIHQEARTRKHTMSPITAQQVVERIRRQLVSTWINSALDVFDIGSPDTIVTGITTSFTPSIDVLRRSVAAGSNLVITQQPAFYQDDHIHPGSAAAEGSVEANFKNDPAYLYKKQFIEEHKLVVWRFYDNWNARDVDGQLLGLARALGWEKYHIKGNSPGTEPYARKNKYFSLPEGSLKEKLIEIESALNIHALRVIGEPTTKIQKASISNGMFTFAELRDILNGDPGVDLIVIAEAIEWESCEYFRDYLTWKGKNKAMVLLGREASEDPGYHEVALWLKTFIPEVPITWEPAGEPFWVP
jgi:putative NIF3 family GTP cyclohydrolase 1 type 2